MDQHTATLIQPVDGALHTGDRVRIRVAPNRANWSPNDLVNGREGTIAEYIGRVGSLRLWGVQIDGYTVVGIYAEDELTKVESVEGVKS